MRISVEQLLHSYGNYLRAKVQELESVGFLGVSFRKVISDHQELEANYIGQMKERREAEAQALKLKLEGHEKAKKPRGSR